MKYELPPNLVEFVEVYSYDVRMVQQNPQRAPEQEKAAWVAPDHGRGWTRSGEVILRSPRLPVLEKLREGQLLDVVKVAPKTEVK